MPTRVTDFTDPFTGTDADLGANWDAGYTSCDPLQRVSDTCQVTNILIDSVETVNSYSAPNNQWDQFTLTSTLSSGATVMLLLRAVSPGANTWYEFGISPTGGSHTSRIVYRLNGTNTAQSSENSTTWAIGDVLTAEAIGTSLSLYRNDGLLVQLTDSNLTSGRVGIKIFTPIQADAIVDNFSAGSFVDVVQTFPYRFGGQRRRPRSRLAGVGG